ncbi:MAG: L-rhamnose mutarotase [Acidobacteria bacterium]|nr:MAG: L-rhamnose mutarotase [Acidobacteriota bacterium]
MPRVAYLLKIRDGREEEYVKEHQNVWPELIQLLRAVGFRNYTIFKRGLVLFVYVEADYFEKSLQDLISHPTYKRWSDRMESIMESHPETLPKELFPMLTEVFHID